MRELRRQWRSPEVRWLRAELRYAALWGVCVWEGYHFGGYNGCALVIALIQVLRSKHE